MCVSSTHYDHKPAGQEIASMKFNQMTISNDMLATFITSGYAYCPTNRKKELVSTSDYICMDIDDCTIPMNEYVSTLQDTPTIYYTTPSNGNVEKSMAKYGDDKHIYRFRLLYALDTPTTDANDYIKAYSYIMDKNNMSFTDVRVANQYYNGSFDCEIHQTNRIYSLPSEYKNVEVARTTPTTQKHKQELKKPTNVEIDKEVLDAFSRCEKYEDFLAWYYGQYGETHTLRESVFRPSETDERILEHGSEYYRIPMKYIGWDKETKTKIYGKWNDGENRHTRIFLTGMILRRLNSTITPTEMLYEIVSILLRYYDIFEQNGELKFSKSYILQLIKSIFKADITMPMKEIKHPSFKVSDRYCAENKVGKRQVVNEILGERRTEKKEKKYSEIDCFYDPSMKWNNGKKITQKQWIRILQENGIEITHITFKRYLRDRGFSKKNKRKGKKKSIITNTNIDSQYTYRFSNDTFLEEDNEVNDGLGSDANRRFLEIFEHIRKTEDYRTRWKV